MRKIIIGVVAGWLAGAAGVLAQMPASPYSPLTQYSQIYSGNDNQGYEEQRVQTMYRPPKQGANYNYTGTGNAATADMAPAPGNAPTYLNCGGRCANGNCGQSACGNCNSGNTCGGCNTNNSCGGCNSCQQGGCPCGPCGPEGCVWFSAEYLMYWVTGQNLPPLVTASPAGTPQASAGQLNMPGTTILAGGNRVFTGMHSGVRARLGAWLDDCNMFGIEGSVTYLGADRLFFDHCMCDANGIVARPFIDVNPAVNRTNAEFVCFPGVVNGGVIVTGRTEYYGADANLRRNLICGENMRIDVIGGYRFLSLTDRVNVQENLVSLLGGAVGSTIQVNDRFATDNRFHGGQLGLAGEIRGGKMFVDWRGTCALGAAIETVRIDGNTIFTSPGAASVIVPGGLLAQPSSIGTYHSTEFSVVPEANINVGADLTPHLRVFVGYTFLYWRPVVRAGDQINTVVNSSQLPTAAGPGTLTGPAQPSFQFHRTDFHMQGIGLGAQLRF